MLTDRRPITKRAREEKRNKNTHTNKTQHKVILMINNINNSNNLLFMCRVNIYRANYRHSTL
jgi:hypothetical protein